jgi:hypothetical protein
VRCAVAIAAVAEKEKEKEKAVCRVDIASDIPAHRHAHATCEGHATEARRRAQRERPGPHNHVHVALPHARMEYKLRGSICWVLGAALVPRLYSMWLVDQVLYRMFPQPSIQLPVAQSPKSALFCV